MSEDFVIDLLTPECELQLDPCTKTAKQGMRVHGCAFHYVCNDCAHEFLRRVSKGHTLYKNMRCASCKKQFSRSSKYFNLVEL